MDKTKRKFDQWALNGKAESMQLGHSKAVLKFFTTVKFNHKFTFLDIGCLDQAVQIESWSVTVSK